MFVDKKKAIVKAMTSSTQVLSREIINLELKADNAAIGNCDLGRFTIKSKRFLLGFLCQQKIV